MQSCQYCLFGLIAILISIYWSFHDPIKECNENVRVALDVLQHCRSFQETWKTYNPTVECRRGLVRNAAVVPELKKIFLNADRVLDMTGFSHEEGSYILQLSMELVNLKNDHKSSLFWKNKCSMEMNEFAYKVEEQEYHNVLEMREMVLPCIKEEQRDLWINKLAFSDLQHYLKVQEINGHTDFYRFNRLIKCNGTKFIDIINWIKSNEKKWWHESFIDQAFVLKDIDLWAHQNNVSIPWIKIKLRQLSPKGYDSLHNNNYQGNSGT